MTLPVLFVVAGAVTLVATPLAMAVARATGVVDRPGALKVQERAVPYLGGAAVGCGVAVGVATGRPSLAWPLAAALVLGVADDAADLPPAVRLVGEVVVGVLVAVVCPLHLPGVVGVPALVVATVLLVNGVNLLDGLDLLATGVVAAAAAGAAAVLGGSGQRLAVAAAAALVGFAAWNRPPARVYLGDGGAYLLGTVLAVLTARAWAPGSPAPLGLLVLALAAVPVGELVAAVVRRARARARLMAGDRGHPYDRLVARGWPRPAAAGAYTAVSAALAVVVVLVDRSHAGWGAALAVDGLAGVGVLALAGASGGLTPDREVAG